MKNKEDKPSIVSVVDQHVSLRRTGRDYKGLCPFHSEKTPSFTVSEEKGLFHCFGCGAGGDVIRFIELINGVSFKEALKRLGIDGQYKPRPRTDTQTRRAAVLLANWLNDHHLKAGALLRELSQQIGIAEQIPDTELVESLNREWEVLSDLFDDLQRSEYAAEFFKARDSIEAITAMASVEPLQEFPAWTREYREYLAMHLPEPEAAPC